QSELIPAIPILDPAPGFVEASNDHDADVNAARGRRNPQQIAGMRSLEREQTRDAIAFGDDLRDGALQVWNPLAQSADERFQAVARRRQGVWQRMTDVLRRVQLL